MSPPRRPRPARSVRFFLAGDPSAGDPSAGDPSAGDPVAGDSDAGERQPIELLEGELEHATRVLRLTAGEVVEVLDGRGGRGRAKLVGGGRRPTGVRLTAPLERTPLAGEPGSTIPHLELLVPPPRGARFEAMLDRLAQLGVAVVQPLLAEHTGPEDRGNRRERHLRVLREACKQSGNPQLPELREPAPLADALAAAPEPRLVLSPRAERSLPGELDRVAPDGADFPRRLSIVVGPEGGFSEAELELLDGRATPVRLAHHVLRIETAAEAAAACVFAAAL